MKIMLDSFVNVHYCYVYLVNQISIGLLMYAHIPAALLAILFGSFVLYKTRNLAGKAFFVVCISFAIWCFLSISTWFSFLGSANTMFTWSLIDFFGLLIFFFSYYFLYTFVTKHDLPIWQAIVGLLLVLPTAIWTFLGMSLTLYDSNNCAAIEYDSIVRYPYFIEAIFIVVTIIFIIYRYIKAKDSKSKGETLLAGIGVSAFLIFFFSSTLLVNLLASSDASLYVYNYEIYGLFGMPILLAFMAYVIVRFKSFNIKMFGAQALILALVALIGSEFFFLQSTTAVVLAAVTLVITGGIGINLMRSVKKEIEARETIEKQEKELEIANKMQADTTSLITHQIRGVFTDAKAGLHAIIDGDFGPVSSQVMDVVNAMYKSQEKGVDQVQSFLRAQKIESGTVQYKHESFDLKKVVEQEFARGKVRAEGKGLQYEVQIDAGSYLLDGDQDYLTQVIANLIDNAVRYTEKGSIKVQLSRKGDNILYSVKDSGVGIKDEDKPNMFKKYGHGKDSRLINVESSGLGLYIVKGIVDAHKGKIWYDTEAGKGTTFYVELPVK